MSIPHEQTKHFSQRADRVLDGPRVHLVGAGPGDPELITLRGLRALSQAEVILPDALLEPGFAALYPATALVLPVGKRCGRHSQSQESIHATLLHHARAGRRVVRLKGGDPLIFGRGGEEAHALAEAHIPFEIIPGVSAAQAAAAAAGVPLTHRGVARSVTFLEGHQASTPWAATVLAAGGTLAIYMGTRRIVELATELLASGADPDLDVRLVENALRPSQTHQHTRLLHAAQGGLVPATSGPGLLLLGAAMSLPFPQTVFAESTHVSLAALPEPVRSHRPARGRWLHRAG